MQERKLEWGTEVASLLPSDSLVLGNEEVPEGQKYNETLKERLGDIIKASEVGYY